MRDAGAIAEGLRGMTGEDSDAIVRRAVQQMHEAGDRYDWVGVYLLSGDELVLHSYVGEPTEHTNIPVGRGVCGLAVAENRDINVADVQALDNYLACSAETRSEIVVLIRDGGRMLGQIDIDSDTPAAFDGDDEVELREIADALGEVLGWKLRDDQ